MILKLAKNTLKTIYNSMNLDEFRWSDEFEQRNLDFNRKTLQNSLNSPFKINVEC